MEVSRKTIPTLLNSSRYSPLPPKLTIIYPTGPFLREMELARRGFPRFKNQTTESRYGPNRISFGEGCNGWKGATLKGPNIIYQHIQLYSILSQLSRCRLFFGFIILSYFCEILWSVIVNADKKINKFSRHPNILIGWSMFLWMYNKNTI